ncbi:unnamed protein product [Trichogramma brassicae]|uniref:Double jelly roll-like domain-containing protein n=1 Tax=Trichogramma brassicae TaxID=86971 RepID=A0A6H5J6B4_9HYME|nr:unnamed protein product [Trichogramma brassicae]
MTMVEGRPMGDGDNANVGGDATVVRPMAVTPTMPTVTVTPTVVVRPMAVTPTTPTLAVTATVVRPMAVTPTTPTLTVTPTVTVLRPSTDASNTTHEHEAFSIGYYIKCSFDESQSVYRSYRMTNEDQMSPAAWFVHELSSIANRLEAIYKAPKKMIITEEQQEEFEKTSTCYICNRVSSRRGQPAKYHRFQSFYIRVFDNCDAQVYLLLPAPFLTPAGSSTLFKSRPVSRIARYNLKWPVSRSPCSDGSPSCGGASSTSSSGRYHDDYERMCLIQLSARAHRQENAGWCSDISQHPPVVDADGNFDVHLPLNMIFGFAEDYKKIIVNAKHELILVRSRTDLNAVVQLRPEAVNLGENPTQAQREAAAQAALPEAFKINFEKNRMVYAIVTALQCQ